MRIGPTESGSAGSDSRVLYVLRHGRTRLNAEGLVRGHLDVELDAAGVREAQALAETFKGVDLPLIVTSPLRRALATAECLEEVTGAQLEVDPAFIDRDYGPWAGKRRVEAERVYGSLDRAPGVEPLGSVVSRVLFTAKDVAMHASGSVVAIVAHDAVNRVLLARLPTNTRSDPDEIPQRTGCWNRLDYREGCWSATVIDAVPGDGTSP